MVLSKRCGDDAMYMPSHAGDGAARRLGHGTMYMLSHAGDDATDVTWLWCDVAADDHANVTSGQICI
jgi:hypothetical protein